MAKHRASALALTASLFLAVSSSPANAVVLETELDYLSQPTISTVLSKRHVEINDRILLSGQGFTQVTEVFVDSKPARFMLLSDSELEVKIPSGVNPGDAVLRISGPFGLLSYQSLFEVLPSTKLVESKVTIGTFQGFAAVYTKNFKGRELRIVVGDRTRVVPQLDANYTQNLTKVGAGKNVRVRVFLDGELLKTEVLITK